MKELIVKVDDAGVYHIVNQMIRCKDCRYWKGGSADVDGTFIPPACMNDNIQIPSANEYCSRAERK